MVVKYGFASQFIGSTEEIVRISRAVDEKEIKEIGEQVLGLPWDENCYYEILH